MKKKIIIVLMTVLFISVLSGCINDNINIDTGTTDSDDDGVPDDEDACPNIFGDASNQGCPTKAPTTTMPVTTQPPTAAPSTAAPTTAAPTTAAPSTAAPTTPAATTPAPTTAAPAGPTYRGTLELDIYDVPEILDDNLLYYIYEEIPGTLTTLGTYYIVEVNLGNKFERIYATAYYLYGVEMIDNGAVFSSATGAASNWTASYMNIDALIFKDLNVRTIEGHDDWWIAYILRSGTYKQVYSQDLKTGKQFVVTTSSCNKEDSRLYGTTVVYSQYNRDWDIYMASVTGGGETALSTLDGDETDPMIHGNDVIYVLKDGADYQLYYVSTQGGTPRKLSDSVGNYDIKDGKILYYDVEKGKWKLAVVDGTSIVGYTLDEATTGDSDLIAVSRTWAYVNGHLFKLTNV